MKNLRRSLTLISLLFTFLFYSIAFAQTDFVQFDSFDNEFLSGFSEDGRIKILLLKFSPLGPITETSAEEFVKALQRNLSNTNHFTVVGPEELKAHLQDQPNLADCHDIACGIQIGKRFRADKVLVGQISIQPILDENAEEVPGFLLSVRLIDVLTNTMGFTDEIQFTDDNMQDELFKLANRISENTLLRGRVLSVDRRRLVIDLGKAHGLTEGSRVVIYKQSSTTDLEGQTLGLEQKNLGIAEVTRVNNISSDALLLYRFTPPEVGDSIKTYVNRRKQVNLIAETRRELDTRKRMTRPTRPLVLKPEVIDDVTGKPIDTDKQNWRRRLAAAQADRKRWMYISIGAGVGTLALLTDRINLGQDLQQLAVIGGGVATGYALFRFFQERNKVSALQAEGRVKNYISLDYHFDFSPQGVQLAMQYKF